MNLPAALERSRSGNGGHVWLFFAEAIPAALARRLGSHLLTETMERRPDIGLDSYDRFFPNQDTLPHGGFGNLIALPLQKGPRELGNSVFLDEQGNPHPDQWALLSQVRKIGRAAVEEIVRDAERRGRIVGVRMALPDEEDAEPWTLSPSRRRKEPPIAGPLPKSLELVLGDQIYIAKERSAAGPPQSAAAACRLPESRVLQGAGDAAAHLRQAADHRLCGGPRRITSACPAAAWKTCKSSSRTCTSRPSCATSDTRASPLDVKFQGELRPEQDDRRRADAARTTRASCPPRPPSARRWLPPG